jgi:hypothetical protein
MFVATSWCCDVDHGQSLQVDAESAFMESTSHLDERLTRLFERVMA